MSTSTPTLADQVDKVAARLTDEYSGRVPDNVVRDLVNEVYGRLSGARVTAFVPVLVDRSVREQLRRRAG